MKRKVLLIAEGVLLAGLALLLQSCITDITAMRADINQLKQDSYQTKKDIAEIKKTQGSIRQNVGVLKDRPAGVTGEDSLSALRASQADLYSQVQDSLKEMQELGGKVDERNYEFDKQIKQLAAEIDLMKSNAGPASTSQGGQVPQNVNDRLSRIEADIVFLKAKLSAIEAQKGGQVTSTAPAAAATPEDEYKQAYDLFKDSKYPEARKGMEEFLDQYPSHPLAGNAQFWIGECFYQEGQYENAILAYEEVIKNFSTNRKVAAAMLKQGFAFANIGDKDAARGILRDVIEKYPGTDLARAAQKKLDTIK